jgi:hypothetical protein
MLSIGEIRMIRSILFCLLILAPSGADAQQAASSPPRRTCFAGPISKTFGGTDWMIYSCDDQASMVMVAAPGNPASPFIFFISADAGRYHIEGEGTGDKGASQAAGDELSRLPQEKFAALLVETRTVGTPAH